MVNTISNYNRYIVNDQESEGQEEKEEKPKKKVKKMKKQVIDLDYLGEYQ